MDDTQHSRVSDAAATRKRRSSILKSQRPPRAPFSELEFNVATPTDTAKSRRVSFSRRTGVAEFVTNEATNTWKNFYEEHNKTLESSGNDSVVKYPRPSVGHIGKRIFDQQFQEVEAVDFVSTLDDGRSRNIETSMNNINFADQLESLECTTDDRKLTAPQQKFELSTLTDHQSKLFGDDLAISGMGELSDRINVNFSVMQPMGADNDDLDEIQRDLQQAQSNGICQGFVEPRDGRNHSEYVEVDLNMTHVTIRNDESDMSITDTIQSPKVQEVPKTNICFKLDNKSLDKDWVADKENIIVNPYVAPKETSNIAVNEESDKVLIFDGKRLTIQSETPASNKVDFRKTLLPNKPPDQTPLRKSIILNVNDDLPNFVDDPFASMSQITRSKSLCDENSCDADLSMTQPLPTRLETKTEKTEIVYENAGNLSVTQEEKQLPNKTTSNMRNTVMYEYDSGDISVTQAILSNIILGDKSDEQRRRKTIVYEDDAGSISITQAVSSNILLPNKDNAIPEKRRTIVFEDDSGNISVTQAIPTNIMFPETKTVDFDNLDDISVTGVVSKESNEKRRTTIMFEPDVGDISMTQVVPTNILADNVELLSERRKTQVYEDDAGNISVTQAVPENLILPETATTDKRKTIVFETDSGDISITQAVPRNLILPEKDQSVPERQKTSFYNDVDLDAIPIKLNLTENNENNFNKEKTTYEHDAGDISITQAVPANILPGLIAADKHRTIVYESESCDISVTQAVPSNIILRDEIAALSETKTTVIESCSEDIPITQGVPACTLDNIENAPVERKSLIYESCNNISSSTSSDKFVKQRVHESKNEYVSLSQEADAKAIDKENANKSMVIDKERLGMSIAEDTTLIAQNKERKRKTIVFDDDAGNMSMTRPISVEFVSLKNEINNELYKINTDEIINSEIYGPVNMQQDIFVYQNTMENNSEIQSKKSEHGDSKIADPINANIDRMIASSTNIAKDINESYTSQFEQEENKPLELDAKEVEPSITFDNISSKEPALVKSESGESKSKKSILSDLLDMSNASMEYGSEDKNIMAVIKSDLTPKASIVKDAPVNTSDSSFFYITKDSEDETEAVKSENSKSNLESLKLENQSQLQLEFKGDNSEDDVQEKAKINVNRHFEAVVSADAEKDIDETNSPISIKNSGDFDNTKELLEMLANFTDKEEKDNPLYPTKNEEDAISEEGQMESLTNRKLSVSPKIQSNTDSIVNSHSNSLISHSIHRQSHESVRIMHSGSRGEESYEPKKCVHLSADARKALKFEDESTSDASFNIDSKKSPLKKTVFGESSYMSENHAAVPIPSYLKDVSDGIKQLMSDLVKPMADVLPFDSGKVDKPVKKMASTCSMQVQANLITSSQIDLDSNMHDQESLNTLAAEAAATANRNLSRALKSSLKQARATKQSINSPETETLDDKDDVSELQDEPRPAVVVSIPGRVLMFDHANPLNNILFAPADTTDAHRYDPIKSHDSLMSANKRGDTRLDERMTSQYYVENLLITHQQAGDACLDKISEVQSNASNMNKPLSIDKLVHTSSTDVKDSEVNTLIVMKGNKELLEVNSSLTFVDDTMANGNSDLGTESHPSQEVKRENSPVEVIYKNDEDETKLYKDSDITSNDEEIRETTRYTRNKRVHSPMKSKQDCSPINVDVTPKPISKKQKQSYSPDVIKAVGVRRESPERTTKETEATSNSMLCETYSEFPENDENTDKSKAQKSPRSPKRSPRRSGCSAKKKKATTITVQQLITEYHIETKLDQELLNDRIKEALTSGKSTSLNPETKSYDVQYSPELASSFTSIRNKNEMGCLSGTTSESQASYSRSKVSPMDWQPELINELSSKNLAVECESGVNVVAKIDMLPFMGSRECEWEASSGDTWSFRLLHGRLRLSVRLAHRHDNATRSCVRADTPVQAVTLETTQQDKTNPVAVLCVNFGAEAMRYFILKGCTRAGDIPALLRRAAGVARVALRWGHAMRDAWAHLAYTLTNEGFLSLKVANISLRSVWEVTMHLELVLDDDREVPWPRARDVRVRGVVSDVHIADEEVRRLLEGVRRDWGHVPRTVWKIFKYLKNKTRDDDLLRGV